MRDTEERILSTILTFAAVVIAISVAYRSFRPAQLAATPTQPQLMANWQRGVALGHRLGPPHAPVTILELADLECPVCRDFQQTIDQTLRSYPTQVAVVHIPYPLDYHKEAMPAARAAECAAGAGRFAEWIDVVYARQDSLGVKSWGSFAREAGIGDTTAIANCARDTMPNQRIAAGIKFGHEIGLVGTPTVIINGWRLPHAPTALELKRIIPELMRGGNPFKTGQWSDE